MGLVKFNNTTLNVEGLPDGAVVITGEQLSSYTQVQNAYTILKSKLPIGISEDQLASLTEKGQRFDQVSNELAQLKISATELKTQVEGFKNIPQGFTPEKWNQLVAKEQNEIKLGKITGLTKSIAEKLQKESKTLPKVNERFLPQDKVKSFDPDAPDAEAKWAQILSEGFQEQTKFAQELSAEQFPNPKLGGSDGPFVLDGSDNNNGDMPRIPRL